MKPFCTTSNLGFTLIELSIVLVIIGLLIGGVLVGQDMVRAAGERAQVTQVEKLNTAANTFRDKFNYLPGDIPPSQATMFGMKARSGVEGQGDGNGILDSRGASLYMGFGQNPGSETTLFWCDLSTANLIPGSFTTTTSATDITTTSTPGISNILPAAAIGRGNYLYTYSNSTYLGSGTYADGTANFFGLSAPGLIASNSNSGYMTSAPALTVKEASDIDGKIDDGLPSSGNVQALYVDIALQRYPVWAAGGGVEGAYNGSFSAFDYGTVVTATLGTATTCYDNNGTYGVQQHYSLEISNGSNVNCALSFRFQ